MRKLAVPSLLLFNIVKIDGQLLLRLVNPPLSPFPDFLLRLLRLFPFRSALLLQLGDLDFDLATSPVKVDSGVL